MRENKDNPKEGESNNNETAEEKGVFTAENITTKQHRTRQTPHDDYFKLVMREKIAAQEFLTEYLSPLIREEADLSPQGIKIEQESFVTPDLNKRHSDIIYSLRNKRGEKLYAVAIIEHQSSIDEAMPLRFWGYEYLLMCRHWDLARRQQLPLIDQILVYNGKRRYTGPRHIWELFAEPEKAKALFLKGYSLVDLQATSEAEIVRKQHLGLMEYFLKNIHSPDLLKTLAETFEKLPQAIKIDKAHNYMYLKASLWYIDNKVPAEAKEELNKIITSNLSQVEGEEIMRTIADTYREEGMERGMKQGMERGMENERKKAVLRMLGQGVPVESIARFLDIPVTKVMAIRDNKV